MCVAEGIFDFDLELKKRSSLATILGKNSYTFDWIPITCYVLCILYIITSIHKISYIQDISYDVKNIM